ncbi:Peroxisome biogenesis protein 2 [Capsicum baccatum]|uniref:Peroxisome biogenesis protein 2 n=1 Tax=Capsicum baccatum TaxID=33114 RepID=A0A2G2X6N8_CAPBA|nr:Peroxisome biogenesis protein 2 [Capsicum baccatum]
MSGSCIKHTQMEEKSLLNLKKNSTVKGLVNSHTVDHQTTSCNQVDRSTSIEGQSSASQIGGQMQKGDITDSNKKNEENKNWCPVKNVGITSNTDQQLVDSNRAVKMKEANTKIVAIVVFAKYEDRERVSLWDDIYSLCHTIRVSGMVGGDFNVIMNEEKIRGTFFMSGSSSYKLDPGPLESSVLTEQLTHRSRDIWDGCVDMVLNTRKSDGHFWKLIEKYPIHPRVLEVIRLSGLYDVYRCNRPAIDRSLITSLVERWHPETHTFHLRTSEATITLQDVEVFYELPVNGAPVLGTETTRTIRDWQKICQRLLSFFPSLQNFKNSFIKVSTLKSHLLSDPQLSDMATQEIVNQKARCYMFWMIAGMMMTDTSGAYLKIMYLPMLEDVNAIGSYSWGSATLAYLYRFLYKASQSTQNEIARFLPLLQVGHGRGSLSLGHRYLPDYCRAGRDLWRVRVSIFCWDVVEVHLPDRVMRQFGLQQVIPTPFLFDSTHFCQDRRGRPNTNWELEHAQRLLFWNEREQFICNVPANHGLLRYDDPYLIWFRRITRLLIGNPNPRPQCQQGYVPNSTAYETMAHHIHSMVDKAKSLGDTPSYKDLYMFRKMVRDQSSNYLRYVHEADRTQVPVDYRRDEVKPDQLRPPIHSRGKGGVAGRRERAIARDQVPDEMNEIDEVMQNFQIGSEDDQATTNHDFGSTSMGCTQEFTQASGMTYQQTEIVPYMNLQTPQISRYPSLSALDNIFGGYPPQHFESAPNFTLSPVPMSINIPDATNNLENLNTEMEDNELDDTNNEVNGNDSEDASTGCEKTIQHYELSNKQKHKIIAKLCGTGIFSYRNLIERALRARLVYGSPNVNRVMSFEYMNCQLAWSEFSESLLLLLPLLNSSSVKNFLRPFSKEKSSDSSADDTFCPICQRNPTNPFLAIPSQHRDYLVVIGITSYGLIIVKRIENSMA